MTNERRVTMELFLTKEERAGRKAVQVKRLTDKVNANGADRGVLKDKNGKPVVAQNGNGNGN